MHLHVTHNGHDMYAVGKTGGVIAGSVVGLVLVVFSIAVLGGCCDEEQNGRQRSNTVSNPLHNNLRTSSNNVQCDRGGGRAYVQNSVGSVGSAAGGNSGGAGAQAGTPTDATMIFDVLEQHSRACTASTASLSPRPISIAGVASVQMHAVADNNV